LFHVDISTFDEVAGGADEAVGLNAGVGDVFGEIVDGSWVWSW
jgi:hypothetical protein